jgi:hypothetical protein
MIVGRSPRRDEQQVIAASVVSGPPDKERLGKKKWCEVRRSNTVSVLITGEKPVI